MNHTKFCHHKFIDSKRCLRCGWKPFCGHKKLSHAGCCQPDPNHSLPGHELPAGVAPITAALGLGEQKGDDDGRG